jgi:hypothetical protein
MISCRVCGCTDYQACPSGCWWVEFDLCSACASEPVGDSHPVLAFAAGVVVGAIGLGALIRWT